MKIPVFATIGRAYGFAFGNLATIIGLIWLPLLILQAASYFVLSQYYAALGMLLVKGDFSAMGGVIREFLLLMFASVFLSAAMAAPVMRQALGLRSGGAFVHFSLGANEFRLFGANLALVFIAMSIAIIAWIGIVIILAALGFTIKAIGTAQIAGLPAARSLSLAVLALMLPILFAFVFVLLRLSFFVSAVAIAERKIDLVRAWTLTQGNFWRILVVLIATAGPIGIAALALQWAFLGTHGVATSFLTPLAQTPQIAAGVIAARLQAMHDSLPVIYGVSVFLAPLQYGVALGAAAAAYRALVPPAEPPKAVSEHAAEDIVPDLAPATAAS